MSPIRKYLRRADERGQASVEMVIILPIIVIFIAGIIAATRLAYTHLALITIANDCATNGSQVSSTHNVLAGDQGLAAAQEAQSTFNIESPVKSAATGMGAGASMICGASLVVWGPPTDYSVRYDFRMPLQPYKSNWKDTP
jgi:Flp pilus assembly protein TadG